MIARIQNKTIDSETTASGANIREGGCVTQVRSFT